MKKIDRKGLLWFLGLTFVFTYFVEFVMMYKGMSFIGIPPVAGQMTVAVLMFFPGISAFIVRKYITKEGFKDSGLKLGKGKYYLQSFLLIPILFTLIYMLTWLFIQNPDFTLGSFLKAYGLKSLPLPANQMITAVFVSTITFAPFMNAIPAFGEEFGWRGYLLPKLMPLGYKKALIVSGIIWGLWHAPLVLMGFKYGVLGVPGVIFFTIIIMLIGIYIGYLRIVSGSVILAAFIHGTFNAQAYGIWTVIFPNVNPLLGGFTGITGIIVFGTLSLWIFRKLATSKP